MTLTDAELGAIEARAAAATPGPWKYGGMIGDPGELLRHFVEADGELICYSKPFAADYAGGDKTFEFIAHARVDIPALIAALRESRERESAYAFALKRIARFENRHGPSDEAQIARAALGEQEAPHA